MTTIEPTAERNLDGYGAPPIPWTKVLECLAANPDQRPGSTGPDRHTFWLATVRPDGRPHVMPLGVFIADDGFYFTAGPSTRKAQNLEHDPHCVLTIATSPFDLVFEGAAVRVTDPDAVARVADEARSGGWPASVGGDGAQLTAEFSAPAAGPPPWNVYKMTPDTAFALGTAEPYGATRYRL